jgi:hypothetical protein
VWEEVNATRAERQRLSCLERQAKLEENEAQYAAGKISEEEFKKKRKQKPFERQKQEELRAIKKVENIHRRRVILRTRSR